MDNAADFGSYSFERRFHRLTVLSYLHVQMSIQRASLRIQENDHLEGRTVMSMFVFLYI